MKDQGHDETEKLIAEMEERVAKEYRQAAEEAKLKLDDYLRKFQIKDEIWRKRVAQNPELNEEYKQWRIGQLAVGKRWQDLVDSLSHDYHSANIIARSIVVGYMPEVYAINHNYATFQVEKAGHVDTSYTLYSRETIERILRETPQLLPLPGPQMLKTFDEWDAFVRGEMVAIPDWKLEAFMELQASGKDLRWQEGQIQSVMMQAIVQGESVPHISARIADTLGEINHKATIRYARTAATAAQNAGRIDAYRRAAELGVKMKQQWQATVDMRTRYEHRILDGQQREIGEPFEVDKYKIMYPGDPRAAPEMLWNCRCTLIPAVDGWTSATGALRDYSAIEGMTYDEWKENLDEKPHKITKQEEIAEIMRRRYIRELYNQAGPIGPERTWRDERKR